VSESMARETLLIERTFEAPADAVFDAWTSEAVLRRWFHADREWETAEATVDLRVDYHRAAMPGNLVAHGKVVKFGSAISVAEAYIYDESGALLASGRGVYSTAPAQVPKAS